MLLASSTCCTMKRCAGVDQIRLIKSISTARFVWSFGMNAACGHRYFLGMGSGGGGGGGGRSSSSNSSSSRGHRGSS